MRVQLFGCPLLISPLFFALLSLLLLIDRTGMMPFVLLAVFLHEAGHLLTMHRWGIHPDSVELLPFEINIQKPALQGTLFHEWVIASAGVAVNLAVALLSLLFYRTFHLAWTVRLAVCNLVLGLFQALPIEGLDGYQAIYLLTLALGRPSRAKWLKAVSYLTLLVLTALSAAVLLRFRNPFLLLFSLYLGLLMPLKERR